jgi:hypothetical protein
MSRDKYMAPLKRIKYAPTAYNRLSRYQLSASIIRYLQHDNVQ